MFVFLVDEGCTLHLKSDIAKKSVADLKQVIANKWLIPQKKQILLIKGGLVLDSESIVGDILDETKEDCIYLFIQGLTGEYDRPQLLNSRVKSEVIDYQTLSNMEEVRLNLRKAFPDLGERHWLQFKKFQKYLTVLSKEISSKNIDENLMKKINLAINLPRENVTDAVWAHLAQRLYLQDVCMLKECENLIQQQHLQQQGWEAAVMNLDCSDEVFNRSAANLSANMEKHLELYDNYSTMLKNFNSDLKTMDKIPLMPSFAFSTSCSRLFSNAGNSSLLDWFCHQESKLEKIVLTCAVGLKHYNQRFWQMYKSEIHEVLKKASNIKIKKMSGLLNRLTSFKSEVKYSWSELKEQRKRKLHIEETLVCENYKSNNKAEILNLMIKSHQYTLHLFKNCLTSKIELSQKLHVRFSWMAELQNSMCKFMTEFKCHANYLARLQQCFNSIEEVHTAPKVYAAMVAEIMRQERFNSMLLQWSDSFSNQVLEVHEQETNLRKSFNERIKNHFLLQLFPDLVCNPSFFVIKAPQLASLPLIKHEEMQLLITSFPDLESVFITDDDLGLLKTSSVSDETLQKMKQQDEKYAEVFNDSQPSKLQNNDTKIESEKAEHTSYCVKCRASESDVTENENGKLCEKLRPVCSYPVISRVLVFGQNTPNDLKNFLGYYVLFFNFNECISSLINSVKDITAYCRAVGMLHCLFFATCYFLFLNFFVK